MTGAGSFLKEESHRMCLDGLYRGIFNACVDLVNAIDEIRQAPTTFAGFRIFPSLRRCRLLCVKVSVCQEAR